MSTEDTNNPNKEPAMIEAPNQAAAVTTVDTGPRTLKPAQIKKDVQLIQQVMKAVMTEGEHYGTIPGCGKKMSLFKPGAEKLAMTFRLTPEYKINKTDDGEHREYEIICILIHQGSGNVVAQGVGCCSTKEGKYRYRAPDKEVTSNPVPRDYWELRKADPKAAQAMLGGAGFGTKKTDDGGWMITKGGSGDKVEHDNPADYYNTVLKMAKKRAHVDATLTATGASDIFTQDIEDMPEVIRGAAEYAKPAAKQAPQAPAPAQQTQQAPAGAPRPPAEQATPAPPAKMTDDQRNRIDELIGQMAQHAAHQTEIVNWCTSELTNGVDLAELNTDEATKVINALSAQAG